MEIKMTIGLMEIIFITGTALFYFYALYVLILTIYENNRSDRPRRLK